MRVFFTSGVVLQQLCIVNEHENKLSGKVWVSHSKHMDDSDMFLDIHYLSNKCVGGAQRNTLLRAINFDTRSLNWRGSRSERKCRECQSSNPEEAHVSINILRILTYNLRIFFTVSSLKLFSYDFYFSFFFVWSRMFTISFSKIIFLSFTRSIFNLNMTVKKNT